MQRERNQLLRRGERRLVAAKERGAALGAQAELGDQGAQALGAVRVCGFGGGGCLYVPRQ